ncbi:hypothetical protein, partial [Arcobacter ellisii]
ETVTITATTTDETIRTQTATGTGTNTDDKGPDAPIDKDVKANIEVSDAGSVKEADGVTLTYSVKLSNAAGSDVEVDLTTGGDATRGSDYENKLEFSYPVGTSHAHANEPRKANMPAHKTTVKGRVTYQKDWIPEKQDIPTISVPTTEDLLLAYTAYST